MDSQSQRERTALDVGTWEQIFQELMQQVKPQARWTLKLDGNLQPDCVAQGWKQYQQRAFGRFWCPSCQRRWFSAQVQVLCHMHLEHQKSQGQVLMRLFAQRCRKCSWSRFEKPEFSQDSTMRILNNLVRRIVERFYTNSIKKTSEIPVKLEVPLEGSHDMINCEACSLGFCVRGLQNCMTKPSECPLSSMEIGSSSPHTGDVYGPNRARNQSPEVKKAERNEYSCAQKMSGPSHSTVGIQAPGASPQPKQETVQQPTLGADRQATRGTGPQPITVAGSLPQGWTDPQPIQAVHQLPTGKADSQSILRREPQAPRRTYSQAVRRAGQQPIQEACSQAIQGAAVQATREIDPQPTRGAIPRVISRLEPQATGRAGPPPLGTDPQTTWGAIPKATSGLDTQATRQAGPPPLESNPQTTRGAIPKATSGLDTQVTGRAGPPPLESNLQTTRGAGPMATCGSGTSGTQAARGRQERCLPRRPAPDSFFRPGPSTPQNDFLDHGQLIKWGCACVVALFTFLVRRYL